MPQLGYADGVNMNPKVLDYILKKQNAQYVPGSQSNKAQEILAQLSEKRAREASPEYQGALASANDSGAGMNPLMASLAKAGAQMGTLRGRSSDTSAVDQMASAMERDRERRMAQSQDARQSDDVFDATRLKSGMAQDEYGRDMEKQRLEAWKANQANDRDERKLAYEKSKFDADMASRQDVRAEREQTREDRKIEREEGKIYRREDKEEERKRKLSEREYELSTPYGLANTVQDAKDIKDAHISKKSFDAKLDELIALRRKYGGELFNRTAVARGKQLSKDLLLEYKNMAKLGVLSQSDTDIINAIIPSDPLEYSPSGIKGEDPILYTMQKFREDSDKDFKTRVATRTRAGGAQPIETTSANQPKDGDIRVKSGIKWVRKNGAWEEVQ